MLGKRRNYRYCSATNCFSERSKNPEVTLHSFPKDEERCKIWVQNSGSLELKELTTEHLHLKNSLCSKHFEDSQFMNAQQQRKKLIWNAIPTLFERTLSATEKTRRQKRGRTNKNGNLVAENTAFISISEYHKKTGIISKTSEDPKSSSTKNAGTNIGREGVRLAPVKDAFTNTYPPFILPRTPPITESDKNLIKLKEARKAIRTFRVRIGRLNKKLTKLSNCSETLTLKKVLPFLKDNLSSDAYDFVVAQFKFNDEKGRYSTRWSSRMKKMALTIYRSNPSAYKTMGKMFVMPSNNSLVKYEKMMKDLIFEECQLAESNGLSLMDNEEFFNCFAKENITEPQFDNTDESDYSNLDSEDLDP